MPSCQAGVWWCHCWTWYTVRRETLIIWLLRDNLTLWTSDMLDWRTNLRKPRMVKQHLPTSKFLAYSCPWFLNLPQLSLFVSALLLTSLSFTVKFSIATWSALDSDEYNSAMTEKKGPKSQDSVEFVCGGVLQVSFPEHYLNLIELEQLRRGYNKPTDFRCLSAARW